jgi:hypothetical protein
VSTPAQGRILAFVALDIVASSYAPRFGKAPRPAERRGEEPTVSRRCHTQQIDGAVDAIPHLLHHSLV